ncbi:MAG: T9SS type A sorting domain-containing protein [Opitutaceae bacterium]|nr:T9SS type A sorting domain-containing protein [Cytophagales bacterium]
MNKIFTTVFLFSIGASVSFSQTWTKMSTSPDSVYYAKSDKSNLTAPYSINLGDTILFYAPRAISSFDFDKHLYSDNGGLSWNKMNFEFSNLIILRASEINNHILGINSDDVATGNTIYKYTGAGNWSLFLNYKYRDIGGFADLAKGTVAYTLPSFIGFMGISSTQQNATISNSTFNYKPFYSFALPKINRLLLACNDPDKQLLLIDNGDLSKPQTAVFTPIADIITKIIQSKSGNLFCAILNSDKVYKSTDNGLTWAQLGRLATYSIFGVFYNDIVAMADGSLLASGGFGFASAGNICIYRSTDEGVTWSPYQTGIPPNSKVEKFHLLRNNTIIARVQKSGGTPETGNIDYALSGFYKLEGATTSISLNTSDYSIEKIYPNPSTGIFNHDLLINSEIKIYDVLGNLIMKKHVDQPFIDISEQTNGVYFLEVSKNNKTTKFRLIKE